MQEYTLKNLDIDRISENIDCFLIQCNVELAGDLNILNLTKLRKSM